VIDKALKDPDQVVHLVRFKKVVCASSTGRRTKRKKRVTCLLCQHILSIAQPDETRRP